MTTERIDHATRAREWAEAAERPDLDAALTSSFAQLAIAHAQLAIAEQARIQNLIALCGSEVETNMIGSSVSYQALGVTEKVGTPENGFIRWHLHPDIAAALGLEGEPA